MHFIHASTKTTKIPACPPISLSKADVSKVFKQVNTRKTAWPDGFPGCVIRACADQPAGIFTDIFILSLSQSQIPARFELTMIIPVPPKM